MTQGIQCAPSEIKRLAELRGMGISTNEIAATLERSRTWVVDHTKELRDAGTCKRVPKRHMFTPEDDAILRRMRAEGKTYAEVSSVMALSVNQVRCRCQRLAAMAAIDAASARLSLSEIQAAIASESKARRAEADRQKAVRDTKPRVEDVRQWMRDEVKRCRKMALRYGWTKRKGGEAA